MSVEFVRTEKLNDKYSLENSDDTAALKYFLLLCQGMWGVEELYFQRDKHDYDQMPDEQKRLLDAIIGFFLPSDGMISDNIVINFRLDASSSAEKAFFSAQDYNEMIHSMTYTLMAQTLYDDVKLAEIKKMTETCSAFRNKTDFMEKWTQKDCNKAERFLAMACSEGIFFITQFMIIFWFRSKDLMRSFTLANKVIARDECIHRDMGLNRCNHYGGLSRERTMEIVKEAVDIEMQFVDWLLKNKVVDLNAEDMKQFVKLVADNLLGELGQERYYGATNPYTWMEDICFVSRTNFFEERSVNYNRGAGGDINYDILPFDREDF